MTFLITACVIVLALLALWLVPFLQVRGALRKYGPRRLPAVDLLKAENDRRSTLAQIFGGVAILAGLYFTAETLRLQQEGQLTDRINKAVDQLASDKPDVVLGGIYEIRRIAHDSPPDRWPMLQVLMSYVERHAGSQSKGSAPALRECDPNQPYDQTETPEYSIQAVANVLRSRDAEPQSRDQAVVIVHSSLRHVDLSGGRLSGARLADDDLTGAILADAAFDAQTNLNFSILDHANLSRTKLPGAQLQHACLVRAQLTGGDFNNAHLEHSDLRNVVDSTDANFTGALLEDTDLRYANLSHARGLIASQLAKARIDCTTMLPQELADFQRHLKCEE